MSKVEPHPTDKGKFQSTFDDYGHGKGNGKSRNAIYKHAKKIEKITDFVKPEIKVETSQNQEKIEVEEKENQSEYDSISWADEDIGDVKPKSIPEPIQAMAQGHAQEVSTAAMGQMIRFGFSGLDRLISHWGRGVMNDPNYNLERHPSDLDALESSTLQLMAHYGIQVPISPLMVWGATVGSAYVPPIMHIQKNADPNRKRRTGFLKKLNPFRRKKKKEPQAPNQEVEQNEPNA